jgi:hypothetical protein
MKRKTLANRVLQTRGWVSGSAVLLLLSAGALTLLAQYAREQANVVTMLLALHLASWSYALGIVGLVLAPVFELIAWWRVRVNRAALSRYSTTDPRRPDLEKSGIEGMQVLQRDMAPIALSRSFRHSDDRNKTASSSKVA